MINFRNLSYCCDTVENYCQGRENTYDLVVASEVIEHVNSLDTFIQSCVHMIKVSDYLFTLTATLTASARKCLFQSSINMLSY